MQPRQEYYSPSISIGSTELETVQNSPYLWCVIFSDVKIDENIENRLVNINKTFIDYTNVFGIIKITSWKTKVKVKNSLYWLSTLMAPSPGLEPPTLQRILPSSLHLHHSQCTLEWFYYKHCSRQDTYCLHYWSYVSRVKGNRLLKILLFDKWSTGRSNRREAQKRSKDSLTKSLIYCGIS